MNWFRQNQFLGTFYVVFGVCTLAGLWFIWTAKSDWDEALRRFNDGATELARLERLTPYPNGPNLRAMQNHAVEYEASLAKLKEDLKGRVLPVASMAPNEFQSKLRLSLNAVSDKARANKIALPDKFFLGFDEFAAALPSTKAAPLLGQELAQIELLVNTMLDARIDRLTFFRRAPLSEEDAATSAQAAPRKGAAPALKLIERNVVEATFVSSPNVARKILNQIAGANQQFYIVRLLEVRNEKEKGPPRETAADSAPNAANAAAATPKPNANAALNFIVGNEHIETSVKIEIARFTY